MQTKIEPVYTSNSRLCPHTWNGAECELFADHEGPHRAGEQFWNDDESDGEAADRPAPVERDTQIEKARQVLLDHERKEAFRIIPGDTHAAQAKRHQPGVP